MSKHTTTLIYGNIDDVTYILDQYPLDEADLRSALLNAFRHIENLENLIVEMKRPKTKNDIMNPQNVDNYG